MLHFSYCGIELWDAKKSILENLYFLASILLVFIAYHGLRQLKLTEESLKLTRDEINATKEREAILLALKIRTDFSEKVVPRQKELWKKLDDIGYNTEVLLNTYTKEVHNPYKITEPNPKPIAISVEDTLFKKEWEAFYNELVTYSMCVLDAKPNEEILYKNNSELFIIYCRRYHKLFNSMGLQPTNSIIRLFNHWSERTLREVNNSTNQASQN